MKQNQPKFANYICMAVASLLLMSYQGMDAQTKKKKKDKDAKVEVAATPPKKDKTIKELIKSSKELDGLFKIYQDTIKGSLQMVISEDQIGKEYIYFSQIADGVMDAGRTNRGSYQGSKIFKIQKYFDKIEFIIQNTSFYFDPKSPLSKSKDANISHGNMASLEIAAHDKEKGLYLIKADDLFLSETFSQIKRPSSPGGSPFEFKLGNLDKSKTKINAIKNYPENTNMEVEYVYSSPSILNGGSNAVADGRNVSIKVYHSLIDMPKNNYEPRFDDPRVG